MAETALAVLSSGNALIVDAVFARPEERAAIRAVADAASVPFAGLWLEAPADILEQRVTGRRGDASDANAAVIRRQLGFDIGCIDWTRIDASGTGEEAAAAARRRLGWCGAVTAPAAAESAGRRA